MRGQQLQKLAKALAVLVALLISYVLLTTPKGKFDPTTDVDEMKHRVVKRLGVPERDEEGRSRGRPRHEAQETKNHVHPEEEETEWRGEEVRREHGPALEPVVTECTAGTARHAVPRRCPR